MDYDFRNKSGPPYGRPMYPSPSSTHPPMYSGPPGYPKIGSQQQSTHSQPFFPPPPERTPSFQQHNPSPSSSSSGLGIKVTLKPEYRITPPPPLLPRVGDVPRSSFQFDFGLERKVLAEAEKENPDWSKFVSEHPPPPPPPASFSQQPPPANFAQPPPRAHSMGGDPAVMKYAGLNREAVNIAVANYGDNPTKVHEFANGFTAIREMGFPTNAVADALFMFENDTEKALSHLLHGSS